MKIHTLTFLLIVIMVSSCQPQKRQDEILAYSGNPIFPGWYADPEGIVFKDEYWVFPTYSAKYENQVFFDAFSSKDLISWKKHSHVLDTSIIKWAKQALWAPSIIEKNDKYYLFFFANNIQSNEELGGLGVAVSDNPGGPFVDALGKPLINEFHNGAQPIDQFVFKDDDGQHYMYYGGWGHCNVVKLSKGLLSLELFDDGERFKVITPDNYVEGPFVFKRNNKYYFMWSEGNWTGPDYGVAYAIGDSPLGPFKRIGKILQQDSTIARGAGHHSVIKIPNSDKYYIVYHRRPLNTDNPHHRETCIDKMTFSKEGYINPIKMTSEGVKKSMLKNK